MQLQPYRQNCASFHSCRVTVLQKVVPVFHLCRVTALRKELSRLVVALLTSEMSSYSPMGGDVAQLIERRTGTPLTQVRFLSAARDFPSRVNFQCRLSYVCPYTPVGNPMQLHLCAR